MFHISCELALSSPWHVDRTLDPELSGSPVFLLLVPKSQPFVGVLSAMLSYLPGYGEICKPSFKGVETGNLGMKRDTGKEAGNHYVGCGRPALGWYSARMIMLVFFGFRV